MEIGILTAFLGGSLSLLGPCGALLLPGFFASTVSSTARLVPHGVVFYLGLILTLVPLGLGIGAVSVLFSQHREMLVLFTAVLLIVLGAMHAWGVGFDIGRMIPGVDALRRKSSRGSGLPRTFLLGAVGGVAGFCAGPILGAVLTLALGQGSIPLAGALLAVYGAGMVVPLMVLAALWDRLGSRRIAWLRGRSFTLFGRAFHATTFITGLLIIGLGVIFWLTNGLVTMPSLVSSATLARWQASMSVLSGTTVQIGIVLLLGAAALLIWWVRDRRRNGESAERGPGSPR